MFTRNPVSNHTNCKMAFDDIPANSIEEDIMMNLWLNIYYKIWLKLHFHLALSLLLIRVFIINLSHFMFYCVGRG